MATNSALNLGVTVNSDGYDVSGGVTARKLTLTGGDVTVNGSGSNTYTFPASTSTLASLTLSETLSSKTLTTPNITGVTNASNATAGSVGEEIRSAVVQGSPITLTNNQWIDVTSISLTAGDWNVTGIVGLTGGAITGTLTQMAITSTSGNSSTGVVLGDNSVQSASIQTATSDSYLCVASFRINISSTTIYYLKAYESFSVGSATAYGRISARRVR